MKQEASTYRTVLDVETIRRVLRDALGSKVDVSQIQPDALDDPVDFAILAKKSAIIAANSAIQIFVTDEGANRRIHLVALGSGALARMHGVVEGIAVSEVVKLSGSRTMVGQVVAALRRADASLQQVG